MWYFGNTRIYAQALENSQKQIIAQLQPLAGGTVYQYFGYENSKVKLTGLVVGKASADHFPTLTTSGTAFTLTSPEGSLGDYIVEGAKVTRLPAVYQTVDTSQDCEAPLYTVELELLKE